MNDKQPLITVITPAYNVARFIEEAISSVVSQSLTDFEYILVDDESTDGTLAVIEEIAAADHRIRVVATGHVGASEARNIGLGLARGRYIAFLDGDDRWHTKFLEEQLSLLQSLDDDVAAVFCRSRIMTESGRVFFGYWQRQGECNLDRMLVESCSPRVGSSLLIKSKAFEEAGLFQTGLQSAQDLEMWLRIQRDSTMPLFWSSSKYLLDVRRRVGSISGNRSARFAALDKIITEYAPAMTGTPRGMAFVRAAVFAFRAGDDQQGELWAAQARSASTSSLLRDTYGRRVLFWSALDTRRRVGLRRVSKLVRAAVTSVAVRAAVPSSQNA